MTLISSKNGSKFNCSQVGTDTKDEDLSSILFHTGFQSAINSENCG